MHNTGNQDLSGYSQLALYENSTIPVNIGNGFYIYKNIFNPVAVDMGVSVESQVGSAGIQWAAATSGNYGSGEEFIATGSPNGGNKLMAFTLSADNYINSVAGGNPGSNISSNIIGLTSGNFNNNVNDIIGVTDGNNFDFLSQSGSSISSIMSSISYTNSFNAQVAISSGYFDPNPPPTTGKQIIGVDASGNVNLFEYLNSSTINVVNVSGTMNSSIIGIATGNFDGVSSNEIAAIDNSTGSLSIYSVNSARALTQLFTLSTGYTQWNGISAGNLDGSGISEIVLHSQYDGQFIVYKYKAGVGMAEVASQAFPDGTYYPDGTYNTPTINEFSPLSPEKYWLNGVMTVMNSSAVTPNAALVTFRNHDGQITAYDLEGQCPGLSLANKYFEVGSDIPPSSVSGIPLGPTRPVTTSVPSPCNITYSPVQTLSNCFQGNSNTDKLDYNSPNTLVASSDVVAPGGSVQFTSGTKIYLQTCFDAQSGSWFDAKIDNSLSCNPHYLKPHTNPNNGNNTSDNIIHTQSSDTLGLLIGQSITRGQFFVELTNLDSTEINQPATVFLYNILGQKITSSPFVAEPNVRIPMDITNQARGPYVIMVTTKKRLLHGKVILQ